MICTIEGCFDKVRARGLCNRHYHRSRRKNKTYFDIRERFFHKTKKTEAGCLEWTGTLHEFGYGQTTWKGKRYNCHRLAWEIYKGQIPRGMFVLHKCDNPKCCNVEHLFLGTQKDNIYDGFDKGRIDKNRLGRLRQERLKHA